MQTVFTEAELSHSTKFDRETNWMEMRLLNHVCACAEIQKKKTKKKKAEFVLCYAGVKYTILFFCSLDMVLLSEIFV